jgi:hypothetical protein
MPKVYVCTVVNSCLVFSFIAGIILMIVLLSTTVNKKVEQNEYAVTKNRFTTDINGVYEQNTYNLKVGDSLIKFKRTFQQLSLDSVSCMTSDKIVIDLDISLQDQYQKDAIIPIILYKFDDEKNYKYFFTNAIIGSIIDACSLYNSIDYYTIRSQIESAIANQTLETINNADIGLEIKFLQLRNIQFPQDLSNIITQKQLVDQQRITELNRRVSDLIAANTTYLESQQQAIAIDINANNLAAINLNAANIQQQVIINKWNQRGEAYLSIKTKNNLNDTQMIDYIKYLILQTSNAPIISV